LTTRYVQNKTQKSQNTHRFISPGGSCCVSFIALSSGQKRAARNSHIDAFLLFNCSQRVFFLAIIISQAAIFFGARRKRPFLFFDVFQRHGKLCVFVLFFARVERKGTKEMRSVFVCTINMARAPR
jgi:hypothetical protein